MIKNSDSDILFLQSPLETLLIDLERIGRHEVFEQEVADRFLLNKSVVYFSLDLISNL